jgi:hypothetical protein
MRINLWCCLACGKGGGRGVRYGGMTDDTERPDTDETGERKYTPMDVSCIRIRMLFFVM